MFVGVLAIRDYNFFGPSPTFYWLAVLRLTLIGFGVLLLQYIRKVTDFRVFDRVVGISFFAAITAVLAINVSRPGDYGLYLLVDLAATSAIYVAVPMRLRNQLALGLYFMAGDIIIFTLTKDAALQPHLYTIIPAFGLVNVTGYVLSRLLNTSRCHEYRARETERLAVAEKEKLAREHRQHEKLEAIGQLAGGVAHDFNNILTAVLGNVSLAREIAAPGTEISEILAEAETASLRARDLNRKLITFARGGSPVKQPTYLADLVRDTVKTSLDGSKIVPKVTIPEIIMAELDPVQIGQALRNMLDNSRKAMPDGGKVWVSADRIDQPEIARRGLASILKVDNYVVLTVADNGPGIPEEHRDKVFQPFFTTWPGASGLGLAVAYSIVKGHDGYISLESQVAQGAAFSIYLPAGIATPLGQPPDDRPVHHYTVLVMDDEENVRKVAGRMLIKLGYDVETAIDGREAIELYREAMKAGSRFDAVILDLTVPGGMGGREVIGILRDIDPSVKAIVSSGYSDDAAMSGFQELGFKSAVHKPYTMAQLREALEQALGDEKTPESLTAKGK